MRPSVGPQRFWLLYGPVASSEPVVTLVLSTKHSHEGSKPVGDDNSGWRMMLPPTITAVPSARFRPKALEERVVETYQ